VSSYGRNAFTRGTPCLRLAWSPLYTSAAATCPGSSRLRRRSAIPPWTCRTTPGVSPVLLLLPDATFPAGAARSWLFRTFVTGAQPAASSAPKAGKAMWGHPYTQSSRNRSNVSVSAKKPYREGFSARPKPYADRKSSAWPDEGEASEDQLPQQEH
jgi:hypothetical protein